MTGPVESAIRRNVPAACRLPTPTGRGTFTVAEYTSTGFVLLLGQKETRTHLPWRAVEEVPDLLNGSGWVTISGAYSLQSEPGTLDAHLKRFITRATAGWVAVVLEQAGVVEIDRRAPARIRMKSDWTSQP